MEINKSSIQKLASLSDEQLKEKISAVARSCGVSEDAIHKHLSDVSGIRKKMNSLSDAQIRTMLNALGEERVNKIKNGLDNG